MAFLCRVASQETDYQRECFYTSSVYRDAEACLAWFKIYEQARDFDMDRLEYSITEVDDSLESWYRLQDATVA